MVFGRFTEFFSLKATRPKSSSNTYKTPGLPPLPGQHYGYDYPVLDKKNSMRLSSSLQDLSVFRQLDPESDTFPSIDRSSSRDLPPNVLTKEDGLSSFSKEKLSTTGRIKWVRVLRVLFCLLVLFCAGFAAYFLHSNWSKDSSKYYVVLDCGSTGTRVYVYQASLNHGKDDSLPIVLKSLPEEFRRKPSSQSGRAYNRMETEPGLDKLVRNASLLKKAVKPLIKWAEKQIPKRSHKSTSIFLCATAGVRRLPSSESEWVLSNVWSILRSSPFLCKREWVKIITGTEEAYFGWIALNYHTRVLGSIPKKETYGALDLGGSSLQVTFESKPIVNDETSLKLSIGRVNHHLSAYSLAGYGLNDAFDKSVTHLLKRLPKVSHADLVGGKVEIKHPCLNSGYKERYTCSYCASSQLKGGNQPSEGKGSMKGSKNGVPIRLIGVPKWKECNELAKISVNLTEWSNNSSGVDCDVQPCALTENLPRPVGQFYAMSGFFVVYRFFNLSSDATLDDVLEKGREFCEKPWDLARKSVAPQPFIEQYCFRAPYIALLLREGLHITDSNVIIGPGSITWTLGVALYEAGKAFPHWGRFHSYETLLVKLNPFVLLGVLFGSLCVLICALLCFGNWWMPKFLRKSCFLFFRHNSGTSSSMLNMPAPFLLRRWSPISTGDGTKMPLSPTVDSAQQRLFDPSSVFGSSGVQFAEASLYSSSSSSFSHSYSSGSLGQMQLDNNSNLGSYWTPHRGQMRLQSRRSQSRDDLSSSLADAHLSKV